MSAFRVVDLEQGTDEWRAWRRDRCTASEAPVIMDAAPSWYGIRTWEELRLEKAGLGLPPSEWTERAWAHGRESEPLARAECYPSARPAVVESVGDPRFAASLDGLGGMFGEHWVEIKCPLSGHGSTLFRALREDIPTIHLTHPYVWWQLVHQAAVTGLATCVLLVWLGPREHAELVLDGDVLREDWPALRAEWERFLEGGPQWPVTAAWSDAARDYADAHAAHAAAKQRLADARAVLESEGDGRGHGVIVTTSERPGTVDWKRAAAAAYDGDDDDWADEYRRPARTVTTIRLEAT